MSEHHRRTADAPSLGRAVRIGRVGLLVLIVATAFLTSARPATVGVRVDTDHLQRTVSATTADPAHPAHLAPAARVLRIRGDVHHRTGTPFGAVPGAIVVAATLLVFVAVASRARPSARRSHPSFLRRGPPLLPTAG
jgi:hypothetical protein